MGQAGRTTTVVFNTTDAGIPVDDAGHLLGGGERGPVASDNTTRRLLDSGALVEVPDPTPAGDPPPDPEPAADAAPARATRSKQTEGR